jgi:hypothetical protein
MLDYYVWKELRKLTKLLSKKKPIPRRPLPMDEDFVWPKPNTLPPLPRPPMDIKIVDPIEPPPRRKDLPLSYEEADMLVDALNIYHAKYLKKIQRIVTPRTKKESAELGARQELFQRLARFRNTYEDPDIPYTGENEHPDYPENVNQP